MNNLASILQSLFEFHESLLNTTMKKREIIIGGDINPLLSVLAEESKLIKKIKETDKRRIDLLGEEAYKSSLSSLIDRQSDGEEKQQLITLHQQLKLLFEKIDRINRSNQELLHQSLAFTQYMIDRMLPMAEESGHYGSAASSQEKTRSVRLFDAKA